jgi:crossover junction endodeoxyribonuclease RuvC
MALQSKDPARGGAAGPRELSSGKLDLPTIAQNDSGAQVQFGLILGIDIGATGGIAVVSTAGELIDVHPRPCLTDGHAGRRAVNGPLLTSIVFASHATRAFVEHVSARPGEGAVGAFAFGRSRGVIEGVLAAAGVRCQFLTPPTWKRAVGLPPGRDKDASRAAAIQRWPARAELFARRKDDGVAEAALIAIAGLIREARQ